MKNKQLIIAVRFKIASVKQTLSYAEVLKLTDDQINQLLDQLTCDSHYLIRQLIADVHELILQYNIIESYL